MPTAQVRYSAADRREQILEAATQLFARQGFQGTTTKQISEQTGVTEALIFRHFASKDELYWAVIERKIKRRPQANICAHVLAPAALIWKCFPVSLLRFWSDAPKTRHFPVYCCTAH